MFSMCNLKGHLQVRDLVNQASRTLAAMLLAGGEPRGCASTFFASTDAELELSELLDSDIDAWVHCAHSNNDNATMHCSYFSAGTLVPVSYITSLEEAPAELRDQFAGVGCVYADELDAKDREMLMATLVEHNLCSNYDAIVEMYGTYAILGYMLQRNEYGSVSAAFVRNVIMAKVREAVADGTEFGDLIADIASTELSLDELPLDAYMSVVNQANYIVNDDTSLITEVGDVDADATRACFDEVYFVPDDFDSEGVWF